MVLVSVEIQTCFLARLKWIVNVRFVAEYVSKILSNQFVNV